MIPNFPAEYESSWHVISFCPFKGRSLAVSCLDYDQQHIGEIRSKFDNFDTSVLGSQFWFIFQSWIFQQNMKVSAKLSFCPYNGLSFAACRQICDLTEVGQIWRYFDNFDRLGLETNFGPDFDLLATEVPGRNRKNQNMIVCAKLCLSVLARDSR